MSDAYAHVYVGVRIGSSEGVFYTEAREDQETCAKGHVRQEGDGDFCGKDGEKFYHQLIRKPTEGFKRFVEELLGWEPGGETWEDGWEDNYRGLWEEHYLFNTNSVTSSEDDGGDTALGVRILDTGGGGRCGPRSKDENEIEQAFESVRELCEAMGIEYKAELFLQLYWSI